MTTTAASTFETIEVGQPLPSLTKGVTLAQIRAYAEASGDRNPIHLDEAFARSVGLPGVIAHGMLTMAFANQMLTDWLGDRSRLKRLEGRFGGMVRPGDEVTCAGTVTKKDEMSRRVVINLVVTNQRDEKVLTKGVAEAEFARNEPLKERPSQIKE
ncbi:MAG: MaoC family dehydratase N-terminal domain-containing protein [Candidatus Dormibacteraeota bacterium]|nr:MaoC family dehydratase N-terminal domain-containing protein [Candidatus Dormibacteraeota bacterium]